MLGYDAQQPKLGPINVLKLKDIQWTPKMRKGFWKMLTIMVTYLSSKSTSEHTEKDVKEKLVDDII